MVSEILVASYTRVVGECLAAGGVKASRIGRSRPSHQVSASSSTNGHRQDDRRVYRGASYNAYIGLSFAGTGPYPSTAASRWDMASGAADGSAGLRHLGCLAPRLREIIVKGRRLSPVRLAMLAIGMVPLRCLHPKAWSADHLCGRGQSRCRIAW